MTNLTAISLFAGVGGFDIALERHRVVDVAAVEWIVERLLEEDGK